MWLLCLGVAPISEPRVLDNPPEAWARHVREAVEAPKEPRGDYGGLGPVTRAPARDRSCSVDGDCLLDGFIWIATLREPTFDSGNVTPQSSREEFAWEHCQAWTARPHMENPNPFCWCRGAPVANLKAAAAFTQG